jgi:hypothetical protein
MGLMLGSSLALGGCYTERFTPWRYRLTLNVMADGVVHTGSSVVQRQGTQTHGNIDGDLSGAFSTGQATIVDLGRGRLLFALLQVGLGGFGLDPAEREGRSWGEGPSIPTIFGHPYSREAIEDEARRTHQNSEEILVREGILPLQARGPVQLAPKDLPDLLTFADINDPRTAIQVSPSHMDRVFGPGVHLVSATLEITTDPVTTGISKIIPWVLDPNTDPRSCRVDEMCLTINFLASDVK